MAILFYFSCWVTCSTVFDFQHMFDHTVPVLFWVLSASKFCSGLSDCRSPSILSQHILSWYLRDDEKSFLWSDFFYFFLDAVDSMATFVYVMHWLLKFCSVTKMLCKWCLLSLMNNKGWYFFLWKLINMTLHDLHVY